MVIGAITFRNIINKKYYTDLKGGILEAFGKLFVKNLRVYIYPGKLKADSQTLNIDNLHVDKDIEFLYRHLKENKYILDITGYRKDVLPYFSHLVLQKIKEKDDSWETMVPKYVSAFIKSKKLFGYSTKDNIL